MTREDLFYSWRRLANGDAVNIASAVNGLAEYIQNGPEFDPPTPPQDYFRTEAQATRAELEALFASFLEQFDRLTEETIRRIHEDHTNH